jgi:Cu/Ag efflux pump CusA
MLDIQKTGDASTLDIVQGVKNRTPDLKQTLPPALNISMLSDQSVLVTGAIDGVVREAVIAACLTAIMILLFLGDIRSTLIIAISIPLAILSSLAVLSALGETLNIMTLGGLALAVGILVDDATVTIENIDRHLAEGKPTLAAIREWRSSNRCSCSSLNTLHLHRLRSSLFPIRSGKIFVLTFGRGSHFCHDCLIHPVTNIGPDVGNVLDQETQ